MRIIKYFAFITILFTLVFMVGCDSSNKILDDLNRSVTKIDEANVYSEFQNIIELENTTVSSTNVSFIELNSDPLQEFANLRAVFLENHLILQEERITFQLNRLDLQEVINDFKESGQSLNEQDKEIIIEIIANLKVYRQEFLETKGDAYLRIYRLRNQYTVEDIDLINETISEVNAVLLLRIELFEKANQDINQIREILGTYLEN